MKRFAKGIRVILTLTLGGLSVPLMSQQLTMEIINGGIDDAELILQEYLKPFANILGRI